MATLPEYLQDQTEDEIMRRMLERVPSDLDKSEGSFIWDAQAPVAFMLAEAAVWAQQVLERGFASSTYGDYLDLRTAEHGVNRRQAVAAAGVVRFTGTAGVVVPKGTIVATPADEISSEQSVEYATANEVTLGSTGEARIPVTAVVAGKNGNVPAGVVTVLATAVSGVSAVTNPEEITGGADVESDESLLERYLLRVRNPGTSGNKAQYVQWASEIPGVGGVQVKPLWQGPGTVGIYLLDNDKRAANAEIVEAVQEYIDPTMDGQGEGTAPAGPVITVQPAQEVRINISAKLTLASNANLEDVKQQIEQGAREYFKRISFGSPATQDSLVRYTRISAVLIDIPMITDYKELQVFKATDPGGEADTNIEIFEGQVAVLGTVNVFE